MLFACLSLIAAILIGVVGQIEMKIGALEASKASSSVFFQIHSIIGMICYSSSVFFYIYALKKIPLSVALPSGSLGFVAGAFLSNLLWNEPFGIPQVIALILIISGVLILTYNAIEI